ncbi:MAG: ATP-binding protein [Alphaproteobacteria bacterium]
MADRPRVWLAWSSGKDSAWMLHVLRQEGRFEPAGLLTTFNQAADRVSMHAVRHALVDAQAAAAGLPLYPVMLPDPCPHEVYAARMAEAVAAARAADIAHIAFGDLFLEEVRAYRQERLAGSGLTPLFPLWGRDTAALAREMITGGLQARLTSIDLAQLDAAFAGRAYDAALLADLPPTADPCGEKGEFHTFAHGGPMFSRPIAVRPGAVRQSDGFAFADLMPIDVAAAGQAGA